MVMEMQRRIAAAEKPINEIKPEDIRVRVVGKVVDKNDEYAVIDDGTGKINVVTDKLDLEPGATVRVIGRIFASEQGLELRSEIIQDINNLDLKLYRQVRELEKRV